MKAGDKLFIVREGRNGPEVFEIEITKATAKTIFVIPGPGNRYRSTIIPNAIGRSFYKSAVDALSAFATACDERAAQHQHDARWARDQIMARQ